MSPTPLTYRDLSGWFTSKLQTWSETRAQQKAVANVVIRGGIKHGGVRMGFPDKPKKPILWPSPLVLKIEMQFEDGKMLGCNVLFPHR